MEEQITEGMHKRVGDYRLLLKPTNKLYCFRCGEWRWYRKATAMDKKCRECGEEIIARWELKNVAS